MPEREGLDAFDIGRYRSVSNPQDIIDMRQGKTNDALAEILSNPKGLMTALNLSRKEAENIRSLVVGAGAGGVHKLLSKHLGDEIAGAIGGFLAGYIAKRVIGKPPELG